MASTTTYVAPVSPSIPSSGAGYLDTDAKGTARDIFSSTAKIDLIVVDNTGNAATAVWLKLYNVAAASVTVGTTVPWAIFKIPAARSVAVAFPKSHATISNLSAAVVTSGGTGGTSDPPSAVTLKVYSSA